MKTEYFEFFSSIKEELKDAPIDIKSSFNNIIEYFNKPYKNIKEALQDLLNKKIISSFDKDEDNNLYSLIYKDKGYLITYSNNNMYEVVIYPIERGKSLINSSVCSILELEKVLVELDKIK